MISEEARIIIYNFLINKFTLYQEQNFLLCLT